MSLIELLVAVTIGGLLIFGAAKVYVDSRATYEVNETAARLQETARYAMSVIEPDIRMSNYWGLVKGAGIVINQAAQTAASTGVAQGCGNNFAHDLQRNLEANNNAYAFGCAAFGAGAGDQRRHADGAPRVGDNLDRRRHGTTADLLDAHLRQPGHRHRPAARLRRTARSTTW